MLCSPWILAGVLLQLCSTPVPWERFLDYLFYKNPGGAVLPLSFAGSQGPVPVRSYSRVNRQEMWAWLILLEDLFHDAIWVLVVMVHPISKARFRIWCTISENGNSDWPKELSQSRVVALWLTSLWHDTMTLLICWQSKLTSITEHSCGCSSCYLLEKTVPVPKQCVLHWGLQDNDIHFYCVLVNDVLPAQSVMTPTLLKC